MMKRWMGLGLLVVVAAFAMLYLNRTASASLPPAERKPTTMNEGRKVNKTDSEWRQQLTPEQYRILREKGTERAFTGKYWNHKEDGTYSCAACGEELFRSTTKYDSGCGWPSFYDAMDKSKIEFKEDRSYGMIRTEVLCKACGGHLGHLFEDGPAPTGQRYCINSASIDFQKKDEAKKPDKK